MSAALDLRTTHRPGGSVLITATGEIDMSNAATLATALSATTGSPVVVDLTGVEYIDSAGLAALFPHVDRLNLIATPLLEPVLTIAGLDDLTTIRDR